MSEKYERICDQKKKEKKTRKNNSLLFCRPVRNIETENTRSIINK